jgi:dimethylhistidine N-methyltransferase
LTETRLDSSAERAEKLAQTVLAPRFWDWTAQRQSDLAAELRCGLSATNASISPKFFYDALGSALFASICELDEYYPTRTEASIFKQHREHIGALCGGATLIDLGAGDCAKAESLFDVLNPREYLAVDISVDYLRRAVGQLQQRHPHIPMMGLGCDFSGQWALPEEIRSDRRVFFYPGSSIGNFTPVEASKFLSQLGSLCGAQGGVMLGIDLVKPKEILDLAYDDRLGVTAAFNLNALRQTNRLIGGNFDLRGWRHLGFFNQSQSRIEMHLEAKHAMQVSWREENGSVGGREFEAGERIHTEYSYKYTPDSVARLCEGAGLKLSGQWLDPKGWFGVFFATPA